jgi:hypothetical protein
MRHIDDKQHCVSRLQRIMDLLHHPSIELRIRFMNPRRIHEHNLSRRMPNLALTLLLQGNFKHSMDPRSCRLRFMRDDSELLTQKSIQQRRLARIRATDDRDETGAKGHSLYYALSIMSQPQALVTVPGDTPQPWEDPENQSAYFVYTPPGYGVFLKTKEMPVTQIETPGLHPWLVWRDNLIHFTPLLFQQK